MGEGCSLLTRIEEAIPATKHIANHFTRVPKFNDDESKTLKEKTKKNVNRLVLYYEFQSSLQLRCPYRIDKTRLNRLPPNSRCRGKTKKWL